MLLRARYVQLVIGVAPIEGVAMSTTTEPRNVPLPTGATKVHDWARPRGGMPYRFITFTDRTVTDHLVRVSIHAFQWADGSLADGAGAEGNGVEAPGIAVLEASDPLNSDQARELAAALLAAADEIDRLEAPR